MPRPKATVSQEPGRRQFHTARPSGQGALDGAAETDQTDCDRRLGASKKGGPIGSPGYSDSRGSRLSATRQANDRSHYPAVREFSAAEFPALRNGALGSLAAAPFPVLLPLRPLENPGSC